MHDTDQATLRVVTMSPYDELVADGLVEAIDEHVCGYVCDCDRNQEQIDLARARGVRPLTSLSAKRAA